MRKISVSRVISALSAVLLGAAVTIGDAVLYQELEGEVGFPLFERNHQIVELTDAGRKFVEEAREAVFHAERAVLAERSADVVAELITVSSLEDHIELSAKLKRAARQAESRRG